MSAAEVLKAIAQLAFHIAQPLRYFQTGVSLFDFFSVQFFLPEQSGNVRTTPAREKSIVGRVQCVARACCLQTVLSCFGLSSVAVKHVATHTPTAFAHVIGPAACLHDACNSENAQYFPESDGSLRGFPLSFSMLYIQHVC